MGSHLGIPKRLALGLERSWLSCGVLEALPPDVGSVPSTHMEDSQRLALCSKGSNALF